MSERTHLPRHMSLLPVEAVAAAAVLALTVAGHGVTHGHYVAQDGNFGWSLLVGLLAAVAILIRRRQPVFGWVAACTALLLEGGLRHYHHLVSGPDWILPVIAVSIYGVAELRSKRTTGIVSIASIAVVFAQLLLLGIGVDRYGAVVSRLVLVSAATITGLYVATRGAYVKALRERAERLERDHEAAVERATADERLRIARELHDVVAHTLTLMVVQSSAIGEQLEPDHPARPMADSLAQSGRSALSETRRMLGLLRPGPEEAQLTPQPKLDEIAGLIDGVRNAGIEADLEIVGPERDLTLVASLSAYRIVQEALTNVIRHANASRAHVRVDYSPYELRLRITDNGAGESSSAAKYGHGVLGMRERIALFGGTINAGRLEQGNGWEVVATIPYRAAHDPVPAS